MDIEIKDTESAITEATNITNVATSLQSINTTLGYLIKQIDANWISGEEGVSETDKDSIYKSLVSCRDCYANQIIPALDKLGTAIIAYANATDALASQGINMTPSAYHSEYGIKADAAINDANSYNSGKNNYEFLSSRMASEENWQVMDECFYFFKEKGLSDEQIAGILGNAALESGFDINAANPTSTAHGLFQWLDSRYPSDWSLETQLEHAWGEMQTRTDMSGLTVMEHLNNCTDVSSATKSFAIYFEGAGNGGGPHISGRTSFANAIYSHIKDNFK